MSDAATLEWVERRSCAFFDIDDDGGSGNDWLVAGGFEHAPPAPDYVEHLISYPSGETCQTAISSRLRIFVVVLPPGAWRQVYVLRAARNLLRWMLYETEGAVFLHGAAFAEASMGRGICVLGASRTGKSTLSYSLLGAGFDWVSQDDLCILPDDFGWRVLGWPGSLRLRRDMLARFPELHYAEHRLAHPANAMEAELSPADGKLHLFPEELAELCGCRIRGEAVVAAFLLIDPDFTGDGGESLSLAERAAAVDAAWDVLPERRPGRRVADVHAGLLDWADLAFNPVLLKVFGSRDPNLARHHLASFAAAVPGWRIGRDFQLGPPVLQSLLMGSHFNARLTEGAR